MNKDIKIIFVDIDWTLLDHTSTSFDIKSINALKEVQKQGVLVYLSTARPYESIMQIKLLDLIKPDGIICTNGGLIFNNDQVIIKNVIPSEVVAKVIKAADRYHLNLEYGTIKDRYFSCEANKYVWNYFATFHENPCPVKKYENEEVTSLLLMCPERFDRRVLKRIPKELDYFRFHPFGVDIRYVRNDKGKGVEFVLKYHNLSYDNALSIGDDLQDIFMFEKTKYSASISKVHPEVVKVAKYNAHSVCHNGVFEVLQHFELI